MSEIAGWGATAHAGKQNGRLPQQRVLTFFPMGKGRGGSRVPRGDIPGKEQPELPDWAGWSVPCRVLQVSDLKIGNC
ncbi:hypothetical protein B9K06_26000 [Bacillus sp. OG2]|nr:hypothetical protein B9K06_26000 [Bacillus sp. OG2]